MKKWQMEACRVIDATATRMKGQVLGYVDNPYDRVHVEVDVWLERSSKGWHSSHKLYDSGWSPVPK